MRRLLRRRSGSEPLRELIELSDEDRRYLTTLHDDSVPLPPGAEEELRSDNPRLRELRDAYAALEGPVTAPSRWTSERVEGFLDLRFFRGETLITWHYRELPRITELKYFVLLNYVAGRDDLGLLDRLEEDGAFGCWTYAYEGRKGRYSRDLLESVNELAFLERELGLSSERMFSVLDIGAGYGRLAHRATTAFDAIDDYCCVDAVPESTFVCEYYLRHRGLTPPARAVPLHEVGTLAPMSFDLAVNIHSWSECTYAAVEWWIDKLVELDVPRLLVVPNEPKELLSLEADGTRRDFAPLLDRAGYELVRREPVIDDPAVAELMRLHDHFHLYERK